MIQKTVKNLKIVFHSETESIINNLLEEHKILEKALPKTPQEMSREEKLTEASRIFRKIETKNKVLEIFKKIIENKISLQESFIALEKELNISSKKAEEIMIKLKKEILISDRVIKTKKLNSETKTKKIDLAKDSYRESLE